MNKIRDRYVEILIGDMVYTNESNKKRDYNLLLDYIENKNVNALKQIKENNKSMRDEMFREYIEYLIFVYEE